MKVEAPDALDALATLATLQLGEKRLERVVFTEAVIQERVREMGRQIGAAYGPGEEVLVLGLLKGSFIFIADLARRIPRPVQVDFIRVSSYGDGRSSTGEVQLLYDPRANLEGRSVILVEDIVDSGITMNHMIPLLRDRNPASLEVCTLLHKRTARLVLEPRWVGFDAPKEFLVGYGLGAGEDFRHLPFIGSI